VVSVSAATKTYDADPQSVYNAAVRVAQRSKYKLTRANEADKAITLKTRMSWNTWTGQEIRLMIEAHPGGGSEVRIVTRPRGFQAFDWGEGQRISEGLLAALAAEVK
jgi:hypothetical protein